MKKNGESQRKGALRKSGSPSGPFLTSSIESRLLRGPPFYSTQETAVTQSCPTCNGEEHERRNQSPQEEMWKTMYVVDGDNSTPTLFNRKAFCSFMHYVI